VKRSCWRAGRRWTTAGFLVEFLAAWTARSSVVSAVDCWSGGRTKRPGGFDRSEGQLEQVWVRKDQFVELLGRRPPVLVDGDHDPFKQ
jgi:hypothetical protein